MLLALMALQAYGAVSAACAMVPPRPSSGGEAKMEKLSFAIVGASAPQRIDDVQGYPTALAARIWQGVEDELVHPGFAITTGDHLWALADHGASAEAQLAEYLWARRLFSGPVYPAMGERECGLKDALCVGEAQTAVYRAFQRRMLQAAGQRQPYYAVRLRGNRGSWTAKLVVVATPAWNAEQAAWLRQVLAEATTYTFVVRHVPLGEAHTEGEHISEQILMGAPYTLLIAGHHRRVQHDASRRQLIVGNGGAPLGAAAHYGYVVARQRSDGAMVLTAYDYDTHAMADRFAVRPDGSAAPLW